jgi:hypothetical protein
MHKIIENNIKLIYNYFEGYEKGKKCKIYILLG